MLIFALEANQPKDFRPSVVRKSIKVWCVPSELNSLKVLLFVRFNIVERVSDVVTITKNLTVTT